MLHFFGLHSAVGFGVGRRAPATAFAAQGAQRQRARDVEGADHLAGAADADALAQAEPVERVVHEQQAFLLRAWEGTLDWDALPPVQSGLNVAEDKVVRVVKLGAFINSAGDFTDQPKVANGASDLMVEVFGDKGRHARAAVGVPVLPLGAAVEVDAVIAIAE